MYPVTIGPGAAAFEYLLSEARNVANSDLTRPDLSSDEQLKEASGAPWPQARRVGPCPFAHHINVKDGEETLRTLEHDGRWFTGI